MTFQIEKQELIKAGRWFTYGVLFEMGKWLLIGLIFAAIYDLFIKPIDDCDKSQFERCGMRILKDNKTGKEYLTTPGGGIIERGE